MSAPTSTDWVPEVFAPWPHTPDALLARVAARSPSFDPTGASGGAPVLIGSAAGNAAADVQRRARGELMERMGNVLAGREIEAEADSARARPRSAGGVRVRVGTWSELCRDGVNAADPADPATGPTTQAHNQTPAREVRQLWYRGRTTKSGKDIWVPAGAAFLHHRPPPGCTATHRAGSTGVAAHHGPDAAAAHAAWEILERDLIRRSWHEPHRHPPTAFDARSALPPGAGELRNLLNRQGLQATALALPSPPGATAVAVCVHEPGRTHQTFGARCGPAHDLAETVTRACWEALMIRWSMTAPVAHRAWDRLARTIVPRTGLDHALWTFHVQDSLTRWAGPTTALRSPPALSPRPAREIADPVALLAAHTGREVIAVDHCAGPPANEGLAVVRLIAPGTAPLPAHPVPGVPPHPFG
ncbi:YcaO-like family protein [Streptomyces sp. NPDC001741]|uniref:YcaO-like family protein n=1 Tax=Streptomyces sp. NPDC001741 TaxID=3364605 RepID=UPI0036784C95